ncbi:YnbE family lipoprotein [Pectobacteriaceae bacterium C52]|uniref:YnbE family lipoprotein n=1 Tax=Serratia sp. (strain ATCC 39006) TaxID=104623 RepID=A0A2I5TJZ2_SERS3|nr:YnbE family lipoprotein [Serratia sp. ATCC 39006]AUH00562.1 YnbE family lipoprotein [Serratia sp. ATCC 39006]AUH04883.1 YnbE family lipoprotein [Serratia sp. ATCC 39006]WJV60756.1 YnbE family lipoprotein [Pectobacteriaceae bacterium C52]
MKKVCAALLLSMVWLTGCMPRIELAASKEPITINMNVKIDHEIHIKVDKDTAQMLEKSDTKVSEVVKKSAPDKGAQ